MTLSQSFNWSRLFILAQSKANAASVSEKTNNSESCSTGWKEACPGQEIANFYNSLVLHLARRWIVFQRRVLGCLPCFTTQLWAPVQEHAGDHLNLCPSFSAVQQSVLIFQPLVFLWDETEKKNDILKNPPVTVQRAPTVIFKMLLILWSTLTLAWNLSCNASLHFCSKYWSERLQITGKTSCEKPV